MGFFDFFKKKSTDKRVESQEGRSIRRNIGKCEQAHPFRDDLNKTLEQGRHLWWDRPDFSNEAQMKLACMYYFFVPILKLEYPSAKSSEKSSLPEDVLIKLNDDISFLYSGIVYYSYLDNYITRNKYNKLSQISLGLSRNAFCGRFDEIYGHNIVNKAVAEVSSVKLGYDDIANDMAYVLTKHVLNVDMLSFNFITIKLLIAGWASKYMKPPYELLDSLQKGSIPENMAWKMENEDVGPADGGKKISKGFSTITFMDTIGLGDWLETRENTKLMLSCIEEFGKVVPGYVGEFHCAYLEYVKLISHIEADGKTIVGFSMHFPCHDVWNLVVATGKPIIDERVDRFSKCLHFHDMDKKNKAIPVRIVCADVLPCYSAGEEISMAVAAFPTEIHYYPNEEVWAHRHNKRLMNKVVDFTEDIHGWFGDLTVIKGIVKSISRCSCRNVKKEQKFFYCVTVETSYGDIGIYHAIDLVREEEREFIREGACIFASCVIQGDVAIGKYENGAIYDEEHCLKLLKECFEDGDFSRIKRVLSENVMYFDADTANVSGDSKKDAVKALQDCRHTISKLTGDVYAYLGKAEVYHGNGTDDCNLVGKQILALFQGYSIFEKMLSVAMNAENKIAKITVKSIKDYEISIRENKHYKPDEYVYLKLIKEALESGNVSRLINYLNHNVEHTAWDGKREKGYAAVLSSLGGILLTYKKLELENVKPNIFLTKVVKGIKRGKIGLGISDSDSDGWIFAILIDIIGDKIGALQLSYKLSGEYVLEKLKPEDCIILETSANKVNNAPPADGANAADTNKNANSMNLQNQQPTITIDDLPKLKKMLDDGVITQEEFNSAKKKVLG